ncbi:hypothetical protein VD0002_g5693 [Verticillium dahliae]|uniref:DUF1996 domain-containing protein n=2 Tax=Verticillium dahliae TaxID=27337 RepID=G2X5A1_VERDV|nr:uncharacterized protein VDAG_05406 [Verticillium dahliae VdLs.17]KAF3343018.1 hypothetical protein VdG2_09005 [Verticillium dahliae VDG2]KAH6701107.1 hypothetical protein EV126DRAFT_451701 [Verticillium dahliae]EGY14242.1 hypothetical protein VDAG_05406 [Verticillium dahliae VdLs.17]PNH28645.1 hypothetical protein BJF96_g8102 [Verticillium dahliae]PNH47985.1 hypothetical protein VD0004_g490 [Verticillium dahliae]
MFSIPLRISFLFVFVLQCLQPLVSAEFRVTCAPFKRERIDPLATPGKENGHMHTFFGSRGIGPDAVTADELRASCGSCNVQADRSSYWIPTLYYVSKNATVPVKVAIFHVYYHGQNADRQPFPADFSIISGNPNLTEDEARAQGGIGMEWRFDDSSEEKESWQLPKQKGSGWLRGNIGFPTSVVRDESLGRYRECASKTETGCFNVLRMFFAIWYDLRDDWFDFEDGAYLTLSSGGGHTYHGDFINGWEPSMAEQIVRDTKNYVQAGETIGGEAGVAQSPACQKLDEEGPSLRDLDWDAMVAAKAGHGTVELGVYGHDLTITDGQSMNATFSGRWGEEAAAAGAAGDRPAGNADAAAPAATSAVSVVRRPVASSVAAADASASSVGRAEFAGVTAEASSAAAAETTGASSASDALPTASADALSSVAFLPGESTTVISWVETRRPVSSACAKKNKKRAVKLEL